MLALLLEQRDEDDNAPTDRHLRDQLVSILVAGHDTSAASLAWTFERLARRVLEANAVDEHVGRKHRCYRDQQAVRHEARERAKTDLHCPLPRIYAAASPTNPVHH